MYVNNNFILYFKREFKNQRETIAAVVNKKWSWAITIFALVGTIFRIVGLILKDAAIEIILVIIFGFIVLRMAQGRDIIVSMFEPEGLYGEKRIFLTLLALIAFSVSMWVIPAVLFEWRLKFAQRSTRKEDPFEKHLFFAHRVLPLIPFWLMAYSLFNDSGWLFIILAYVEMCLFLLVNSIAKTKKARLSVFYLVLAVMLAFVVYFTLNYKVEYLSVKRALAVILYLLSFLIYMAYYAMDTRILNEHKKILDEHNSNNRLLFFPKRYPTNTIFYIFCLAAHIVLVALFINQILILKIAPESMLLYVFALYVFVIDFTYYVIALRPAFRLFATLFVVVAVLFIVYDVREININHYTVDRIKITEKLTSHAPFSLDDYYRHWKTRITSDTTKEYPIILIAGEGGGSRAGFWFSQNLIDFDHATNGKFREHIFSISTVSGSTVGLGTYFAYLDQPLAQANGRSFVLDTFLCLPEKVYRTNFVGSSISGLFIADLYHALLPGKPTEDRNNVLMKEESEATLKAIVEITGKKEIGGTPLDEEYMSVFYDKNSGYRNFRMDHPLALINTTRSNDGRRGIFAPIKLDSTIFNDAIDINSYLYKDSLWAKLEKKKGNKGKKEPNSMGIKFGVACVASELFPILSAPMYIDSLGSFVDGGYHENTGLKTTLDVYNKLKQLLRTDTSMRRHKYHIYILYLKNGGDNKDLYEPQPSVLPILQPLSALLGQPFNGSASYFEERAKYIADTADKSTFIKVSLDSRLLKDSSTNGETAHQIKIQDEILKDLQVELEKGREDTVLNFPLARWLSHSVIRRMKKNQQRVKVDTTVGVGTLLQKVKAVHN